MVDAWAADAFAGKDTAMYAWRRTNVDDLNRRARDRWAIAGRLHGPDLAADGRCYAAGDLIVTLAPAAGGQVVTSERGVVESVDVRHRSLTVRMDDGRLERLAGEELGKDRLAHGYAITVHRSQASTVDIAHRLEDGGGRSLAYVSMSRARETNTVHVVADDLDQAVEDLTRDWSVDRRARWAIDSGTPATHPLDVERHQAAPATIREALRLARLEAQRQATAAAIPPDRAPETPSRRDPPRRLAAVPSATSRSAGAATPTPPRVRPAVTFTRPATAAGKPNASPRQPTAGGCAGSGAADARGVGRPRSHGAERLRQDRRTRGSSARPPDPRDETTS